MVSTWLYKTKGGYEAGPYGDTLGSSPFVHCPLACGAGQPLDYSAYLECVPKIFRLGPLRSTLYWIIRSSHQAPWTGNS